MRRSHQLMFEHAFERIYMALCEMGVPPDRARERAADTAWAEYERYCDDKLAELKEEPK
jgi:hypothetical protein